MIDLNLGDQFGSRMEEAGKGSKNKPIGTVSRLAIYFSIIANPGGLHVFLAYYSDLTRPISPKR